MPSDYAAIRSDNERRYGTDIARIGGMLLADRYAERTHFIFELLQNAEDALEKRDGAGIKRGVHFSLSPNDLMVSHYGKPFDAGDVRGICGIADSAKDRDLTSIGTFGIGFKSVYTFTNSPEIHSGDEHFAIDYYVLPRRIDSIDLREGETVIRLPFNRNNESQANEAEEILDGLQNFGAETLLFLRAIEEISWSAPDGSSGLCRRANDIPIGKGRHVIIKGQGEESVERWLIFSREVSHQGMNAGRVEIAFELQKGENGELSIQPALESPLVVYFPTVLETHLGFLAQGPYRTTPSRDNVPENDAWNRQLVRETSLLLVDALIDMRDSGMLKVPALMSLPLDANRFVERSRFAPLHSAARRLLTEEPLLPRYQGGYISARQAKLARTQDLRDLISNDQLTLLFSSVSPLAWLSEEITVDRTPGLRDYFMKELQIEEVTPEGFIARLTEEFLELQTDEWVERLYEFLNGQKSLIRRLMGLPLVRLQDGSHVVAFRENLPQAYLPPKISTDFPTVRNSVCQTETALEFLQSLGLNYPDPVDEVIVNVLPKYRQEHVDVSDSEYQLDIERALVALDTDSRDRRDALVLNIRDSKFVLVVDSASKYPSRFVGPAIAYQSTQRIRDLFDGVERVLIVDDSRDYLRGRAQPLLRAIGVREYLAPIRIQKPLLTEQQKTDIRQSVGQFLGQFIGWTRDISEENYDLLGLKPLLAILQRLPIEQARSKATLLWDALCDSQTNGVIRAFEGQYHWFWYREYVGVFTAKFVDDLNNSAWVPNRTGQLVRPSEVMFEDTGWKQNPTLTSQIHFMPNAVKELAREAGFELEALAFLRSIGCTTQDEIMRRIRVSMDLGDDDAASLDSDPEMAPAEGSDLDAHSTNGSSPEAADSIPGAREAGQADNESATTDSPRSPRDRSASDSSPSSSRREFVSYVGVRPDAETGDPDGLSHEERMSVESQAISLILSKEPNLHRTPTNNPGFDLTESGPDGEPVRWIEVKATTSTLDNRPVTISRTQFEHAQRRKDAYWLYVVERAGEPEHARIICIKDPAGKVDNFAFDHRWVELAEEPPSITPPGDA